MNGLPNMHDGFFDGLWTSNKSTYLFLRTYTGERSTIVLQDVERLNVSNFKAGNMVFDVVLVDSGQLTVEHIEQLYESDSEKAQELLKRAQQQGFSVLEVNPSYGADCTVLFRIAEILPGHVLPAQSVRVPT